MPGLESILEHPQRPAHPSWRKVFTHIHLQAFKKTYLHCLKIEREENSAACREHSPILP